MLTVVLHPNRGRVIGRGLMWGSSAIRKMGKMDGWDEEVRNEDLDLSIHLTWLGERLRGRMDHETSRQTSGFPDPEKYWVFVGFVDFK